MRTLLSVFCLTLPLLGQYVPNQYFVELDLPALGADALPKNQARAAAKRNAIRAAQGNVTRALQQNGDRVLAATENAINGLIVEGPEPSANTPGVRKVYRVPQAEWSLDRALSLSQVPEAWARSGGMEKAGLGMRIGILDSGISPNHPGFQDDSLTIPVGFPRANKEEHLQYTNNKIIVARSYEEIYAPGREDTPVDVFGHGTFVSMCAGGVRHNGPTGPISGVAPKAFIGMYKLGDAGPSVAAAVKALDDALADGMDVVNMSFGSVLVTPLEDNPLVAAMDRVTRLGMIVVVSAGNSGPNLNTMGDNASSPLAIAVGATRNDRFIAGSVSWNGGASELAYSATSPHPETLTGTLKDAISPGAPEACTPLPEGSFANRIALISVNGCALTMKAMNLLAAGAKGAIFWVEAGAPGRANLGTIELPAVMVTTVTGRALRAAGEADVLIRFDRVTYPQSPLNLASFSSRGPTYQMLVKPDLVATGQDIFSATQALQPTGLYDPSGYTLNSGTSFSSPIVAGAAALVKGARPGLTVDQYRSLLINSATPYFQEDGSIAGVMRAGAGLLNVDTALQGTAAMYPTSLSFGAGSNLAAYRALTITNLSNTTDTFDLTAVAYDAAPRLLFKNTTVLTPGTETMQVTVPAGGARTVYVQWLFPNPLNGEYQGLISITSANNGTAYRVPYWYANPSQVPSAIALILLPGGTVTPGQTVRYSMKVLDATGVTIMDPERLNLRVTVLQGGGSATGPVPSTTFPGFVDVSLRTGPTAGPNQIRIEVNNLTPATLPIITTVIR